MPATALAAEQWCGPSGDTCTSVRKFKGVRTLSFATFALRGSVAICVTAAEGEAVCKTRKLRRGKFDLYKASLKWSSNYPRDPAGKRSVTFEIDGAKVGPALTFTTGRK